MSPFVPFVPFVACVPVRRNFHTTGNKPLACGNVYRTLTNHFYYGIFEFPKKSGNWYQGKHEPLISKELFDEVQKQLKRDSIVRQTREFAFTKLIMCGLCGSTFSAEEKYKQLKDGTVAKYIYYGCGRARDLHCKNTYLREEELVEQLIRALDQIDLNNFGIQHKFQEELRRFNKFQRGVLGLSGSKVILEEEVDLRTYAKYILKEGTGIEKRELMGCFKSRVKITKGVVTLG